MKRVIAICLTVLMMVSLCACGTTEKWLLMKETYQKGAPEEELITYTYDDFGNVSEVLEKRFEDDVWYKINIKDNKIDSVESNFNDVYADEGLELTVSLESDYEYTLLFYFDDYCYLKVAHILNDNGRFVKTIANEYNAGTRIEIIRSYNKDNALTAETYTKYDLDTNEVLDQYKGTYYCAYDSNQLPIAVYNSDEYGAGSPEPYVEYVWDLVEVKK